MSSGIVRRRLIVAAALLSPLLALVPAADAQPAKPDRKATIEYINNVQAKCEGAVLTTTTLGPSPYIALILSHNSGNKTYRMVTQEKLQATVDGYALQALNTLERFGWNMRNAEAIEDLPVSETRPGGDVTSSTLRRVRVTFRSASVRQVGRMDISHNGRTVEHKVVTDNTINFVSFFYRASDPDDGKRLRNALLRLKELDEQERDPFLD